MNKAGLTGDNWLLFKNWYEGLNSKIKWQGQMSRSFSELQGVRQGGVWSPTAYKVFINSLLKTYEKYRIGSHIGSIYVGSPTVADDVTLIANCPFDLQILLDLQTYHAHRFRYITSSEKSCILDNKNTNSHSWTFNGTTVETPASADHLHGHTA